MTKKPKNLSQAIEDMEQDREPKESASASGPGDVLRDLLEKLRPHFDNLAGQFGEEAKKTSEKVKGKVEHEVQKNPLLAVGLASLVFFILGFLLGSKTSKKDSAD